MLHSKFQEASTGLRASVLVGYMVYTLVLASQDTGEMTAWGHELRTSMGDKMENMGDCGGKKGKAKLIKL